MNESYKRICAKNRCVEGEERKDGSVVTFNYRKPSGGMYSCCDYCQDYKTNVLNPNYNPKRKRKDQKLPLVYIISNPAWDNWFKVGYSDNWYTRKGSYNTASPLRDFYENFRIESQYAKQLEALFHDVNGGRGDNGEWYNRNIGEIIEQLELLHEEIRAGVIN